MPPTIQLSTQRCTIVDVSKVSEQALTHYFLDNAEHLRLGGGPKRENSQQVHTMLESWRASIKLGLDVRYIALLDENVIGTIGITNIVRGGFQAAYLGYNIAENQQNKGLMTEMLAEVIKHAFEVLKLHRLMANYRPENIASARVLEKLGFTKEGFAKNYLMVDGQWRDHVLTSLTNHHWLPNH
jgi:ribosomal-protein-alanine N-acetyltransferase